MASKIQQFVPTFKLEAAKIGFLKARFALYKGEFENEGWGWDEFKRHLATALILEEMGL